MILRDIKSILDSMNNISIITESATTLNSIMIEFLKTMTDIEKSIVINKSEVLIDHFCSNLRSIKLGL